MQAETLPTFADVEAAAERIAGQALQTRVVVSPDLNQALHCQVFLKCENQQAAGAFKFRGACNAVMSLRDEQAARGVATHSSGNHAAALSLAATKRGIPAYIVMPDNAPEFKQQNTIKNGGQITFCKPTLEARETTCQRIVQETGATLIHPYNDPRIIAGQATAAKELIEKVGQLDVVMTPVGGGGLLSGTAIATHALLSDAKVWAGEPKGADDAARSLAKGKLLPSVRPRTIADGLLTSLGTLTFAIIQKHVAQIITVSDEQIRQAMLLIHETTGLRIEPSAAVPAAALMKEKDKAVGKRIGIIMSGGNIAEEEWQHLIDNAD